MSPEVAHVQQAFLEHVAGPHREPLPNAAPWAFHTSERGIECANCTEQEKGTAKVMALF